MSSISVRIDIHIYLKGNTQRKETSHLKCFVPGGPCEEGQTCDSILDNLEEIDDEADEVGIHFVTTEETDLAKRHGITTFPTLAFFRNQDPLIYKGKMGYKTKSPTVTYKISLELLLSQGISEMRRKYWRGSPTKVTWSWPTALRK